MKNIRILLFVSLVLGLFACAGGSDKSTNEFDYGKVEGRIYSNEFFGFTMELPENWQILSEEANKNLMEQQKGRLKAIDKIEVATLLTALQIKTEEDDNLFNANIVVVAESLKNNKRVNNAADYLMLTRKALDMEPGQRKYPDKALITHSFGGAEWAELNVLNLNEGDNFEQQYLSTLSNGFAVTIIKTYFGFHQKALLDKITETIEFK